MKPNELILHCYAKKEDDYWIGLCLDFDLAVQAESCEEVHQKLIEQIHSYLEDALSGEDRPQANVLLQRKAPMIEWLKYYLWRVMASLNQAQEKMFHSFNELIPLRLC